MTLREEFDKLVKECAADKEKQDKDAHCNTVLQGWVCPRCGTVNSPFTSSCHCAASYRYVTYDTETYIPKVTVCY